METRTVERILDENHKTFARNGNEIVWVWFYGENIARKNIYNNVIHVKCVSAVDYENRKIRAKTYRVYTAVLRGER